jgi:hypothetical protein
VKERFIVPEEKVRFYPFLFLERHTVYFMIVVNISPSGTRSSGGKLRQGGGSLSNEGKREICGRNIRVGCSCQ